MGLIAGAIIGSIVFIILLIGAFLYWRQRREESEGDESDRFSIIPPSYIERIKGQWFGELSRSSSRRTAVDPEHDRTDMEKEAGYGFGVKKLWNGLKELVSRNPDPITPPLPFQSQQAAGGVGEVPGSRTRPRMGSVSRDDGGYIEQPNAANVWMNGSRKIDQNSRFSNQSLEQAWDNRGNGQPYAQTSVSRQGSSRNQSTPFVSSVISLIPYTHSC